MAPDIFHKRFGGPCVYIIHIKLNYVNVYVLKIYGKSSSSEISYKHLHKIQFSYIISRTFALEQQVWPLVLNACSPCNNRGLKKWPSCSLGDWYHTRHLLEEVHWATEYSPMITAFKKKHKLLQNVWTGTRENYHHTFLSIMILYTFPGDKKSNSMSVFFRRVSLDLNLFGMTLGSPPVRLGFAASLDRFTNHHTQGFGETVSHLEFVQIYRGRHQ